MQSHTKVWQSADCKHIVKKKKYIYRYHLLGEAHVPTIRVKNKLDLVAARSSTMIDYIFKKKDIFTVLIDFI